MDHQTQHVLAIVGCVCGTGSVGICWQNPALFCASGLRECMYKQWRMYKKKVQYLICCVFEVDPGVYASGAPQPVASILVTSRITRSDTGISKLLDLLSATFTFCMVIAASFITILACNGSHDS